MQESGAHLSADDGDGEDVHAASAWRSSEADKSSNESGVRRWCRLQQLVPRMAIARLAQSSLRRSDGVLQANQRSRSRRSPPSSTVQALVGSIRLSAKADEKAYKICIIAMLSRDGQRRSRVTEALV